MSQLNEEEFNSKIIAIIKKLVFNETELPIELSEDLNQTNIFIFLNNQLKSNQNYVSLSSLRLILMANFLAKFLNKKLEININLNSVEQNEDSYSNKLVKVFEIFKLNENLKLNFIHSKIQEFNLFNQKLKEIDEIYKIEPTNREFFEQDLINFSKIISDFNLKNYDANLKHSFVSDLKCLLNSYQIFLENNLAKSNSILSLCSNSDYFQQQKVDLLSRIIKLDNQGSNQIYSHKFICIGSVKPESISDNLEDENDSIYNYELREKFFRYSAEQRKIISDDLSETNIKNFTKFSLIFDLLNSSHQNDIKKFKLIDMSNIEFDDTIKLGEQSSFIMYNCARLHAIIEKFQASIKQGAYQELKNPSELNFFLLLKTDFERKLCEQFLFKYETILNEISNSILFSNKNSLQIKINTVKICNFLIDLTNLFSKYYSKIHILEDPKFGHLHDTMNARIYLLKSIYNLLKYFLNLFNIDALKRI